MIMRDAYEQQFNAIHPFEAYKAQIEEVSDFKIPVSASVPEIIASMRSNFTSRSQIIDLIFKMGDGCKLSSFSIHAAIRYLDIVYCLTAFKD